MRIGASLADLADLLVVNESPIEFVASDVGVSFHNEWGLPARGVGMLVKYDPAIYAPPKSMVRVRAVDSVRTVNRLQYAYAERHIYFSGDHTTRESLVEIRRDTYPFGLTRQ